MEQTEKDVRQVQKGWKLKDSPNTIFGSGFSSDCSWNIWGWHRKEGVVAAISNRSQKIADVVHKSQSYPLCKKCRTWRGKNKWFGLHNVVC